LWAIILDLPVMENPTSSYTTASMAHLTTQAPPRQVVILVGKTMYSAQNSSHDLVLRNLWVCSSSKTVWASNQHWRLELYVVHVRRCTEANTILHSKDSTESCRVERVVNMRVIQEYLVTLQNALKCLFTRVKVFM